ncbi:MAG: hypothetical protein V1876_01610 [Candidatus Peregrinibacteria bacterium]
MYSLHLYSFLFDPVTQGIESRNNRTDLLRNLPPCLSIQTCTKLCNPLNNISQIVSQLLHRKDFWNGIVSSRRNGKYARNLKYIFFIVRFTGLKDMKKFARSSFLFQRGK